MAHLSSCYFCASALETAVERYELPDGRTTVTLCSTCREKLSAVFEATGVEGPSPTDDAERTSGQTATPLRAGEEHPSQRLAGTTESPAQEQAGESDQETGESAGTPGTETPDSPEAAGGEKALFEDETELLPENDPLVEQSGPDRDRDDQPEPTARPDTDKSADGDVGADAETRTGSEEPPQGDGPTGPDQGSRAGGDDETGGPEPSLTALEYNRVMRILQNREFPVDRREILTVAASAYDLTEQECAQVIDLAVDRGLLAERDGQLRRPQD